MAEVNGKSTANRTRRTFTAVGIGSLVAVAVSCGLYLVASAAGVHCPECDRRALGPRYVFWSDYFSVMNATLLIGVVAAFGSVAVAPKRKYAMLAILLAIVFMGLRPI